MTRMGPGSGGFRAIRLSNLLPMACGICLALLLWVPFVVQASPEYRCDDLLRKSQLRDSIVNDVKKYHDDLQSAFHWRWLGNLKSKEAKLGLEMQDLLMKRLTSLGYNVEVAPKFRLRLLPNTSGPFGKMIEHLNALNFEVLVDPRGWRSSMGSINDKTLFMDLESLSTGKASAVLAHELKHIFDELESRKLDGEHARLFQTFVDARDYHTGTMPEYLWPVDSYPQAYSLDEIPAYRLTLALKLRELQRAGSDDEAIYYSILNTTVLLRDMAYNFEKVVEHFHKQFAEEKAEAIVRKAFPDDIKESIGLKSSEYEGLKLWLDVLPEELEAMTTTQARHAFIQKRLEKLKDLSLRLKTAANDLQMVPHQKKINSTREEVIAEFYRKLRELQFQINLK